MRRIACVAHDHTSARKPHSNSTKEKEGKAPTCTSQSGSCPFIRHPVSVDRFPISWQGGPCQSDALALAHFNVYLKQPPRCI